MFLTTVIGKMGGWDRVLEFIPFLMFSRDDKGIMNIRLDRNAMIQAILIGVSIGIIMSYYNNKDSSETAQLREEIAVLRQEQVEINRKLAVLPEMSDIMRQLDHDIYGAKRFRGKP